MKNYWFIGDLHGEIRLLNSLLDQLLGFQPELLVFVGDYIDRGPHAREVVERIMGLEVPVACLMGNHEMMMLNAMDNLGLGQNAIELWYYNGGEATLQSFGFSSFFSFQSDMDPVHLDFFHRLKMSQVVEVNDRLSLLGTHAGISPAIPVHDQIEMADFKALDRYLLEKHIDPGDSFLWVRDSFFNMPADLCQGYLVLHGHTPVLKLKRFIASNGQKNFMFVDNDICIRKDGSSGRIISIDIDSGSVISGRLTGLGFFVENEGTGQEAVRMRSITVSDEDVFPRDLGTVPY